MFDRVVKTALSWVQTLDKVDNGKKGKTFIHIDSNMFSVFRILPNTYDGGFYVGRVNGKSR